MIIVEDVILSERILDKKFVCNLEKCKGACCVEGDAGAPLVKADIEEISTHLEQIKPFMLKDSVERLENGEFYTKDPDGEWVTECMDDGACIFVTYHDSGSTQCAIEQAHKAGIIPYKKPMSCHLYPIRAKKYGAYTAMNYHEWDICSPACSFGSELNVPVYEFLKDALTRKMGPEWYHALTEVAQAWEAQKSTK